MEENKSFVPLTERVRPSISAAAWLTLLASAGLWAATLVELFLPPGGAAARELFTVAVYYIPFVLLPVVVYAARRRGLTDGLRLNPMGNIITLLSVMTLAVLCVYAASAIDSLWVTLLDAIGLKEPVSALETGQGVSVTLLALTSAVVPAVCEELLFRGVVFSAFEGRGTWRAIWLSSAVFALMHGNLYGLPAYFLVGAMSAFIVFATDSLYSGMLFHTTYNAAILVIVHLVSAQAPDAAGAAAYSGIGLIVDVIMVLLMIAALIVPLNLRRRLAGIEPVPRSHERLTGREKLLLTAMLALMTIDLIVVQALTQLGL